MSRSVLTTAAALILLVVGITVGFLLADSDKPLPSNAMALGPENAKAVSYNPSGDGFVDAVKQVGPSVVNISTEKLQKYSRRQTPFDFFFESPFGRGDERSMEELPVFGLGSGVIMSSDGIILTNNHVVEAAEELTVTLSDGRQFEAEVVGTDPATDLAVISIDAGGLPYLTPGDSDDVQVGQWVLAIGNPRFGNERSPIWEFRQSVSAGIISAKGRADIGLTGEGYEDFLQTDAAINPGNSGGALINLRGELVGINTAIASRSGGFEGIGYAIPVNMAQSVMDSLIRTGKVERGWLGVVIGYMTEDLSKALDLPQVNGVIVSDVANDGPAKKAGIKVEDVITHVDGKEIRSPSQLRSRIGTSQPGSKVDLTFLRDGRERSITVSLGTLPEELGATTSPASRRERAKKESLGMELVENDSSLKRRYDLPTDEGLVVTELDSRGVAARNGLVQGDIILELDKETVNSLDDFEAILDDKESGDVLLLYILRGNSKTFLAFQLP